MYNHRDSDKAEKCKEMAEEAQEELTEQLVVAEGKQFNYLNNPLCTDKDRGRPFSQR